MHHPGSLGGSGSQRHSPLSPAVSPLCWEMWEPAGNLHSVWNSEDGGRRAMSVQRRRGVFGWGPLA